MAKKKVKDMTSEEILNSMKDVKVTNLKDGDVLVGDGKGGMINKPLKEVEKDTLQKIINLNEELTAENARLLTELEAANDKAKHLKQWNDGWKAEKLKLQNDLELETHFKCNEMKHEA